MTEKLFHITRLNNIPSILSEGLTAPYGNYFSKDINNAARFITLRRIFEPDTKWAVIEVDPEGLEVKQSNDHNPDFFGTSDSWYVDEVVPPENFITAYEIEWDEPDEDTTE